MKRQHVEALERIVAALPELGLGRRFCTRQTAICLYALLDTTRRSGLLAGKDRLADGARIHDIPQSAREGLGVPVAENTRESYRKTSLRPLNEIGAITRHQLSTNDPNTFYRLSPTLVAPLQDVVAGRATGDPFAEFRRLARRRIRVEGEGPITVAVSATKSFELSPGDHSRLSKAVVEGYGPAFVEGPEPIYIGDTARKRGYQDRRLMRELNMPVEVRAGLPDVVLLSQGTRRLVVCEVVTSTGPITASRLGQLKVVVRGPVALGYDVDFVTAFPSRAILRRFIEEIAWGTSVWIEAEPDDIILFQEKGTRP